MIRCPSLNLFKKSFVFFLFLLFSLASLIYFGMIRRKEKDLIVYEKLVQESKKLRSKRALDKNGATVIRSDVQKDIWMECSQKGSHIQISSEGSTLKILEKEKKFYAKELFDSLTGWVDPNGTERYQIEAQEGFYQLPDNKLFAKKVKLSADSIFFVEADRASLESLQDPLELEGNIRFLSLRWQQGQTYALAHRATYFPQKELFILRGLPQNPVLCWQNGSALAAPELHMEKSSKTVQAFGDVRCSFDQEEQKTLREIFSRYL